MNNSEDYYENRIDEYKSQIEHLKQLNQDALTRMQELENQVKGLEKKLSDNDVDSKSDNKK